MPIRESVAEGAVRFVADGPRRREETRAWYRYATRLLPEPSAGGRWLDLGCGQGELLELAGARGLRGMGLDFARRNAAAVVAHGRPALVADLTRPLPLRSASLDGATLVEVIEHIVNAEALLAELARVIRPRGWLVLTTPNVVHLTYRLRALRGRPPKQEGRHYRFFTRSTLAAALADAGFRISGRASFGKQALLTTLGRGIGRGRDYKCRYAVPAWMEGLLAQHFVWRLERVPE
jgi:2-polyprenyl-3-methyl-5-hydroxy-6-metoxy-1,4-benzoquinol methylase